MSQNNESTFYVDRFNEMAKPAEARERFDDVVGHAFLGFLIVGLSLLTIFGGTL